MESQARVAVLASCTVDLHTGALSGGRNGQLTNRELLLLRRLIQDSGRVVPREALFEAFGYVPNTRSRAIDKTMTTLRAKVEVDPSAPDHLVTRYGEGYAFHPFEPLQAPRSSPRAAPADQFVGRSHDVATLTELLARGGLVTLVGPGGVGKTRLAAEALDIWAEGGLLVELVAAVTRQDLVDTVAIALGHHSDSPDEHAVGQRLAGRAGQVVVLDNLEHLLEHADVVARWSQQARDTTLLVTSRTVLRIRGERVVRVEPLAVDDARTLLLARAEEWGHPVREDDVGALVPLLDGLPLALELAAAGLDVHSASELADQLKAGQDLRNPLRDAPARFESLQALLDWSWVQLPRRPASLLAQLSVFNAPFTRDAAHAVSGRPMNEAADLLAQLVARSLVHRTRRSGEVRFRLLGLVRAHAAKQLSGGDRPRAMFRYASHYAARDGRKTLGVLPDVRAALDWAIREGHADIAADLLMNAHIGLSRLGRLSQIIPLAAQVLSMPDVPPRTHVLARMVDVKAQWRGGHKTGCKSELEYLAAHEAVARDPTLRIQIGLELGALEHDRGHTSAALLHLREAVALAHSSSEPELEARALRALALTVGRSGDAASALAVLHRSLELSRALDDQHEMCGVLSDIGRTRFRSGDVDGAQAALEEALEAAQALGQISTVAIVTGYLGVLEQSRGRLPLARTHLERAVELHRRGGSKSTEARDRMNLGLVYSMLGHHERAFEQLRTACELHRALGNAGCEAESRCSLGIVLIDHGRLEDAHEALARALELARSAQHRAREAIVLGTLAAIHGLRGEVDDARRRLRSARTILRTMGHRRSESIYAHFAGVLELDQGDPILAVEHLTYALRVHREVGAEPYVALGLSALAVPLARSGEHVAARSHLREAESMVVELEDSAVMATVAIRRAQVEAACGEVAAAWRAVECAESAVRPPQFVVESMISDVRTLLPPRP